MRLRAGPASAVAHAPPGPPLDKVLEKGGPMRAYKLAYKQKIGVNPLLRVLGLQFYVGAAGEGGQRRMRSGADAIQLLPEDTDNALINCIVQSRTDQA